MGHPELRNIISIKYYYLFSGGAEECKKKWTSVRDQFRRTLQKRKTVSGQAAITHRKYKYEDLLQFLVPLMAERETLSNVSSLENSEFGFDNEETDDDTLQEYLLDVSESAVTQNTAEDPEMASQNNRENIEENCQVTPANTSVKNKKFVRPGLLK